MALGAMIGAFGANVRLASSAAIGATTMLQVMGNAQKSRRIVRSARSTAHMFNAMRRAASSAGIMKELMETFAGVFIILKPFLPFLKLMSATIQLYLLPAVKAMIEAFTPLYEAWNDFNKHIKDAEWDAMYANIIALGILFEKLREVNPQVDAMARGIEMVGSAVMWANDQFVALVSALIEANGQIGGFVDFMESIADIAENLQPISGGGGNGDGDGGDSGGGGGGGIDFPDLPEIPPIIFLQKGGIPTKPTLGVVEPHEAVIPLDTLEFTFQDLKSAASSTNLLLAKNNRLLEKLSRRLA